MRHNKPKNFAGIKFVVCDRFHMKNHKCSKKRYTRTESNMLKGINTSIAEQFNAWIRKLNTFLNGLRPASHRMWVEESVLFWNANIASEKGYHSRRSTGASRAARSMKARK